MKPQRRWIKSVIAAASDEQIMLPWARRRMASKSVKVIKLVRTPKPRQITREVA